MEWCIITIAVFSLFVSPNLALNCGCDSGPQCQSGSCQPIKNWYGPEHCQLAFDPTTNEGKSQSGCGSANFHCDLVSENDAIEVTFKNGQLSSFGGCCSEDECNKNRLESILAPIKNASCPIASTSDNSTASSFSCHCDPDGMVDLFDLSVNRGVQWLSTLTAGNASAVLGHSSILRKKMANFCTNNICSISGMMAGGIAPPSNTFPSCARYVRSDTGRVVRGCAFLPINDGQNDTNTRLLSQFPTSPVVGSYDVRVGLNMTERYSFIFECRSDMCNERQFYENVMSQCLPGIQAPVSPEISEAFPTPPPFQLNATTGREGATVPQHETTANATQAPSTTNQTTTSDANSSASMAQCTVNAVYVITVVILAAFN